MMKKHTKIGAAVFSAAIMLACFTASGQKKSSYTAPNMPVDEETKLITYEKVVEVPATSREELYRRTLEWFNGFYKNPTEVIRERDSINHKIVGKPRFRIMNEGLDNGIKSDAGLVQYTITVAMKENRAKYTISEINWKQASHFPIEKWVEQKDRYLQNHYYLYQTDSVMKKDVMPSLEKALKTPPKKSDKDNW